MVVPVTPLENPHRMVTRVKDGFRALPDRLILAATTTSLTPSRYPVLHPCYPRRSQLAHDYGG
jgi:hypothetical protein